MTASVSRDRQTIESYALFCSGKYKCNVFLFKSHNPFSPYLVSSEWGKKMRWIKFIKTKRKKPLLQSFGKFDLKKCSYLHSWFFDYRSHGIVSLLSTNIVWSVCYKEHCRRIWGIVCGALQLIHEREWGCLNNKCWWVIKVWPICIIIETVLERRERCSGVFQ